MTNFSEEGFQDVLPVQHVALLPVQHIALVITIKSIVKILLLENNFNFALLRNYVAKKLITIA